MDASLTERDVAASAGGEVVRGEEEFPACDGGADEKLLISDAVDADVGVAIGANGAEDAGEGKLVVLVEDSLPGVAAEPFEVIRPVAVRGADEGRAIAPEHFAEEAASWRRSFIVSIASTLESVDNDEDGLISPRLPRPGASEMFLETGSSVETDGGDGAFSLDIFALLSASHMSHLNCSRCVSPYTRKRDTGQ